MGYFTNAPKIQHLKSKIQRVSLTAMAFSLFGMYLPAITLAVSDTAAPTIATASLVSPATITATEFGGLIEVRADFADDLSGFNGGTVTYTSPSGHQTAIGDFSAYSPGYYAAPTLSAYPEQGTWLPSIRAVDHAGNTKVYSNSELVALGYELGVTISGGTSDNTAPTVTNLSRVTPNTLVASENGAYVEVASDFADELSGFNGGTLTYTSSSGNQSTYGTFSPGNTGYITGISLSSYPEQGTWTPTLNIVDRSGNSRTYTNAQLQALNFDITFTVSGGTSDTTKPTVTNLRFDVAHPAVEAPFGGAIVTLTANISDNLSGINETNITYTSPDGKQSTGTNFSAADNGLMRADITLPPYAESGTWTPHVTVSDRAGNVLNLSNSDLQTANEPAQFSIFKNNAAHVAAGGSLTSDIENDGATPTDPVEATLTTPIEGDVSIVAIDSAAITDATNGYTFFGRQMTIVAPIASVESPLSISFRIDASKVPAGQTADDLQVVKNGSILAACVDGTTANPDACVYSRQTLADGDVQVSVHSTTASVWTGGFPTPPPIPTYNFQGFYGLKNSPALNKMDAGSIVPLLFSLGGNKGLNILSTGSPNSKKVLCTTLVSQGAALATKSALKQGLLYVPLAKTYAYTWQTDKTWKGTCRELDLQLNDGSTHKAYFKFN